MTQALVTRVRDPGGLLYGALIAASVLAATSVNGVHGAAVGISTAVTVIIYWLAHVYIEAQTLQLAGDRRHALHRLAHAAASEVSILQGGAPALVVYSVVVVAGATDNAAAWVATWFSILVLMAAGWVTARSSGRRGAAAALDALVAGLFGVVVVVAKASLH